LQEKEKPETGIVVDPARWLVELVARTSEEKKTSDEIAALAESLLPG
jgi:hypothetical protein